MLVLLSSHPCCDIVPIVLICYATLCVKLTIRGCSDPFWEMDPLCWWHNLAPRLVGSSNNTSRGIELRCMQERRGIPSFCITVKHAVRHYESLCISLSDINCLPADCLLLHSFLKDEENISSEWSKEYFTPFTFRVWSLWRIYSGNELLGPDSSLQQHWVSRLSTDCGYKHPVLWWVHE